jgi:hypothetical protein
MTAHANIEELESLLPFYVNGTLSAGERLFVDAALAQSEPLRAALAQTVLLANRVKVDSTTFVEGGTSLNSQLANVMSRIDALPARQMPQSQAAQSQAAQSQAARNWQPMSLRARLAFLNPNRWHPAVTLGLAFAVLVQGAMLLNAISDQRALETSIAARDRQVKDLEFQLASGPGVETTVGNLVIQLDRDASWSRVEAILVGENLKIVSGPQDGTLTLSSGAQGVALDAMVARLRASPLIASADKAL